MLGWQAALAGFGSAIVLAGVSIFVIELCIRNTKSALSMLIYLVPASVLAGLLGGPGYILDIQGLCIAAITIWLLAFLLGAFEARLFSPRAQVFRWQRK